MEEILSDFAVSMSEFKKNPAAVLRQAGNKPVAVLDQNKTFFYMVQPQVFEAMLEELADKELYRKVVARVGERAEAIELNIDDI